MKPTLYKIGEGEWRWLSKDMQEVILAYEEEIRNLKSELSKFSDSFKKYRDYEKEELAESCYDLARENEKLKLHIEAKDKAYTALLKDYEELKEDNKRLRAEIEEWSYVIRKSIEK